MPTYRYEASGAGGKVTAGLHSGGGPQGRLAAASRSWRIHSFAGPAESVGHKGKLNFSVNFGPSAKDIQNFTSQLAVMIRAGISIRAAIEGISEQIPNPKFRAMLVQMKKDVESGKQFSDALLRYPKTFSPLYINMVKASELSGGFSRMLDRIAGYLAQQIETRSMVVGAMIYPAIIGLMATGTTIFLLAFVLPRFMVLFQGKEDALPAPTKLLLFLSGFLRSYWYILLFGRRRRRLGILPHAQDRLGPHVV